MRSVHIFSRTLFVQFNYGWIVLKFGIKDITKWQLIFIDDFSSNNFSSSLSEEGLTAVKKCSNLLSLFSREIILDGGVGKLRTIVSIYHYYRRTVKQEKWYPIFHFEKAWVFILIRNYSNTIRPKSCAFGPLITRSNQP